MMQVVPQTTEQRAIAAAIPLEAKRFLISYDFASDDTTATEKDAQSISSSVEKVCMFHKCTHILSVFILSHKAFLYAEETRFFRD